MKISPELMTMLIFIWTNTIEIETNKVISIWNRMNEGTIYYYIEANIRNYNVLIKKLRWEDEYISIVSNEILMKMVIDWFSIIFFK